MAIGPGNSKKTRRLEHVLLALGPGLLLVAVLYQVLDGDTAKSDPARPPLSEHTRPELGVDAGRMGVESGAKDAGVAESMPAEPRVQVAGQVLNGGGEPVSGATVELRGTTMQGVAFGLASPIATLPTDPAKLPLSFDPATTNLGNLGTTKGTVPPITAAAGTGPSAGDVRPPLQLVTDDSGQFSIGAVPPGTMRLLVQHPGYAPARSPEFQLVDEIARHDLTVVLPDAGLVRGRITDDTGKPLRDVQVALNSETFRMAMLTLTDEAGEFLLGPVAGPCQLQALPVEGAPESREFVVPAGEEVVIEVTLHRGDLELIGRVEDVRGQAIAGASVELRDEAKPEGAPMASETESDGSFALRGLAEGRYALLVRAPGYAQGPLVNVQMPQDAPLNVELLPGLTLEGEVLDARSGAPIPGVKVTVAGQTRRTNHDGTFEFQETSAGEHELIAESKNFATRRMRVLVESRPFDRPSRVEVELDSAVRLSGTVVDKIGVPVPDATVIALAGQIDRHSRSASDGTFQFDDLTAGAYALSASHDTAGLSRPTRAMTMRAGDARGGIVVRLDGRAPSEAPPTGRSNFAADAGPPTQTATAEASPVRLFTLPPVTLENRGSQVVVGAGDGELRAGDRILSINDETIYSAAQGRSMLRGQRGSTVTVVFKRGATRIRRRLTRP